MQNPRRRQVVIGNQVETLPRHAMPLTATPKRRQPGPHHLPPEHPKRLEISRYRMIVEVTLHHRPQPFPGLRHTLMPPLAQLLLHYLQFAPQPLFDRLSSNPEPATFSGLPAHVRKS